MFDGSVNYSVEIEKRIKGKNPSYIDAVMDVCDTFGVEPQAISKHLSKTLIEKIRIEASAKHMIRGKEKYKGSRLPL